MKVVGFEETSTVASKISIGDQLVIVDGKSVLGATLADAIERFGIARSTRGDLTTVDCVFFKGTAKFTLDPSASFCCSSCVQMLVTFA